jgi:transcriptional regulatory protein GAL4
MFARGALDIGTSDGDTYYLLARDALKRDMLHGGTLELVQGLGMMANYLQQSGRPNAGYMALGWAIRMAMALGLHTPSAACTPLERETRLRVWWAIVTMEAGCCATFGRPHAAGAFQLHTTPLPINCDDEHLTVVSDTAPTSVDRPTLYTALGYQSRLAQATCAILDRILHSNPAPTLAQLRRYDGRILVAIRDMPEYMCALPGAGPHQLALNVQRWRTRDLRAILYRPLLLGVAWRSGSPTTVCPEVLEAIEFVQHCWT